MDVLDHSCSKMGFGGKMCIDGTAKFEEEIDEMYESSMARSELLAENILVRFNEIKNLNVSLIQKEIPVLIISVEKNKKNHIRQLHSAICKLKEIEGIKMILYVEHTVDANDLGTALWRLCNNLDPKRDNMLEQLPPNVNSARTNSCLGLDGTRKTKDLDNFQRDWPNIIVADDTTIKSIDDKWEKLGLGEFIPSPSLKFKEQMYGESAVSLQIV